ncbi:MAG: hypothetical protein NVS2B7_25970 [Herpetosiphon sp.]
MLDKDQQLIDAAIRYLDQLNDDHLTSIDAFVASAPPAIREELAPYLVDVLHTGDPAPTGPLSDAEQAMADRVTARVQRRITAEPVQRRNLVTIRTARKQSVGAVARQINLPVDLLARIERGAVAASSLPARLIARLATVLGTAEEEIRAALTAPPMAASAVRLSARDGTTPPPEAILSFADALAASTASPEQRAEWSM